jgi:hypothetical protein
MSFKSENQGEFYILLITLLTNRDLGGVENLALLTVKYYINFFNFHLLFMEEGSSTVIVPYSFSR